MNKKISDKDIQDWETFLSKKDTLPIKDNLSIKKKKNLTKVVDLHGHTLDEANQFIKKIIENCYADDIHKLIIITGKGLHSNNNIDPYKSKKYGILKYSVPEFIRSNTDLMKLINYIEDASIEDGGSGSFYVYLKKKKK